MTTSRPATAAFRPFRVSPCGSQPRRCARSGWVLHARGLRFQTSAGPQTREAEWDHEKPSAAEPQPGEAGGGPRNTRNTRKTRKRKRGWGGTAGARVGNQAGRLAWLGVSRPTGANPVGKPPGARTRRSPGHQRASRRRPGLPTLSARTPPHGLACRITRQPAAGVQRKTRRPERTLYTSILRSFGYGLHRKPRIFPSPLRNRPSARPPGRGLARLLHRRFAVPRDRAR